MDTCEHLVSTLRNDTERAGITLGVRRTWLVTSVGPSGISVTFDDRSPEIASWSSGSVCALTVMSLSTG